MYHHLWYNILMDIHFESQLNRILSLMVYEMSLDEIHDKIVGPDMSEECFFLTYQAASIIFEEQYK